MSCTVKDNELRVEFANCTRVITVPIVNTAQLKKRIVDQITLEKTRAMVDAILAFCSNDVKNVALLMTSAISIYLERHNMGCTINVLLDIVTISWHNDGIYMFNRCSHSEGFDEFLERFSKTPFYKRPEFIKVAARNCSD
jgi:hypothetical protein